MISECLRDVHVEYASVLQYVEDNLAVMSIGFLLSSPDDAVIWRGPKKNGAHVVALWISVLSSHLVAVWIL